MENLGSRLCWNEFKAVAVKALVTEAVQVIKVTQVMIFQWAKLIIISTVVQASEVIQVAKVVNKIDQSVQNQKSLIKRKRRPTKRNELKYINNNFT